MKSAIRPAVVTKWCVQSWRVSAGCDQCHQDAVPCHLPQKEHGLYCVNCCPACLAQGATGPSTQLSEPRKRTVSISPPLHPTIAHAMKARA